MPSASYNRLPQEEHRKRVSSRNARYRTKNVRAEICASGLAAAGYDNTEQTTQRPVPTSLL